MSGGIEQEVKKIIAEELDKDINEISPDKAFIEDLGADSLDLVELVMKMEDAFEIVIPDDDAEKIRTVKDAINYVKSKSNKG